MNCFQSIHQILVSREYGGAEKIALQLACHFEKSSHGQSLVWLPGSGPAEEHARSLGLPLLMYDGKGIFSHWRAIAAVANFWNALRFQSKGRGLVHIHSPVVYGAMQHGLRLTSLKRIVHVHIEHELDVLRWSFRTPPEVIITCAKFLGEQVRQALPPAIQDRQRIVAISNAVDTATFTSGDKIGARRRLGVPLYRPLVLMLANLAPHKGQETAIRAVAALHRRNQNVTCWLAGVDRSPGRQFEIELRQLIDRLGLQEFVKLLGYREDSVDLLRAADVVLLPSTNEGLPPSILEAQACRVPVIAAATAGIPEIIRDGKTGFLVPALDIEGYASRIELLSCNRELRENIGSAAETFCRENHSWEVYYRRLTDVYSSVLD